MSKFNDFVQSGTPLFPQLPLTHICEAFDFRNIAVTQQLATSPCNVFAGEHLLYFFYGKPAYRPFRENAATSNLAFMSVCILLKPEALRRPKRVAPFDTGAFQNGLFKDQMHPKMKLDDFLLDPTYDMPARVVGRFYDSNKAYYSESPVQITIPPLEFEAASYYGLISAKATTPTDDRRSTIEVQSDSAIALTTDLVLLIVLPRVFLDDSGFRTACSALATDIRMYSTYHCSPREY